MRVLLLEDNTIEALTLQRELGGRYDIRVVSTLAEAIGALTYAAWQPDVIVADLNVPDSEGAATLEAIQGGVDLPDVEGPGGSGAVLEFDPQLVAVAWPVLQEGQEAVTDGHDAPGG